MPLLDDPYQSGKDGRYRAWMRRLTVVWLLASFSVYISNGVNVNSRDSVPASLIPITVLLDGTVRENHPRVQMASVAKLRRRTFQEADCRRGVEKKSHPKGMEHDGEGH